jgi:phosphoribosylformimino-5-aminoimidazole carboxamide ribotide isomerase
MKIQTGGGIRTMTALERLLETHQLERVVLGTAAVKDRRFTEKALTRYPDRIAIGLDARDGMVCIEGWTKDSGLDVVAFAREMADLGRKRSSTPISGATARCADRPWPAYASWSISAALP